MVRRASDGVEAALDVLADVLPLAELEDFPGVVLDALRAAVPFDVATYNEIDVRVPRIVEVTRPRSFAYPPGTHERFAELLDDHPLIAHYRRTGDARARRISDMLSQPDYRATRIYREVYRELGVEHQVAFVLPAERELVIGIALSRADRDFDDAEVAVLEAVRPSIATAYRNSLVHTTVRQLLNSTLGAGPHALVACRGRHLLPLDAGADYLLRTWFPTPASLDDVADWVETERARYRSAVNPDPLPCRTERRRAGALTLRLIPAADGALHMLVLEPEPTSNEAARGLGLSARQTEVVRLVAAGHSNAEIASQLHISVTTVKKHLEHIYHVLGVNNRTAAVARFAGRLDSAPERESP